MTVSARKIAHYFYSDGNELVVFAHDRNLFLRDKDGHYPFDPIYKSRQPNPAEGTDCMDNSYEALGLYYGYEMAETGWSGDC